MGAGIIATIGSSILCMSLPHESGLNAKHIAWVGKLTNIPICSHAKILSQCTCKLWMIFIYCKTKNINNWYMYLLTEGEVVIIMDKASADALQC